MTESEYLKFLEKTPSSHSVIDQQNPAAVLAPFVEIDGETCLLLEKRANNIPQAGEICFPGGRPDPGDRDLLSTALRETREELGISEKRINIDGLIGTLIAGPGMVDVYIGRITAEGRDDFTAGPDEVDELLFIPFSWFLKNEPDEYVVEPVYEPARGMENRPIPAKELGLPEKYHHPWRGRPHSIYFYLYNENVIWGMTARMIREIVRIWKS